jgi:hypothetical protein
VNGNDIVEPPVAAVGKKIEILLTGRSMEVVFACRRNIEPGGGLGNQGQ